MQVNIYKDRLQQARLFGASVLYSAQPIPREDVPEGWYCYDLRGTAHRPDEPYALVDRAEGCYAGSVLSYLPLKSGRSREKLVRDMFQMTGTSSTLAEFCEAERVQCPKTPIRYMLRPASPSESELFYALPPEKDEELGAVGHVRMDFGRSGKEFWHTWWPRGPQALNTPKFQYELGLVSDDLRKGGAEGPPLYAPVLRWQPGRHRGRRLLPELWLHTGIRSVHLPPALQPGAGRLPGVPHLL